MKNAITICLLALSTIPTHAQWWGKGIKGNGNKTSTTRSVGDYDQVHVAGFFDVELVAGPEGSLTIAGESNLLEYVITEVR